MKVMERRKFGNLYTHHFAIGRTLEGNDGEGLLAPRDLTLLVHSGKPLPVPMAHQPGLMQSPSLSLSFSLSHIHTVLLSLTQKLINVP